MSLVTLHVCLAAVVALCLCGQSSAQLDTGNMRDLGYPEPNWYPIVQGNASSNVIVINPLTQHWGTISPYQTGGNASLCKWFPPADGIGRGTCKTDVSWIHSALGLSKALFDDPVVNYILRCGPGAAGYKFCCCTACLLRADSVLDQIAHSDCTMYLYRIQDAEPSTCVNKLNYSVASTHARLQIPSTRSMLS
jgi:hypothetical protein